MSSIPVESGAARSTTIYVSTRPPMALMDLFSSLSGSSTSTPGSKRLKRDARRSACPVKTRTIHFETKRNTSRLAGVSFCPLRKALIPDKTGAPQVGAALLRRTSVLPQAKPRRRRNSLPPSISKVPGIQKKEAPAKQVLLFWEHRNTIDAKQTLLIYCIAFQVDSRDIAIIPANDHFQGRESVCIIAESFRRKLL